ncbi:MAG: hypothetical protein GY861_21710 [bacterium]|nr:hypothetical protein [bacterium]
MIVRYESISGTLYNSLEEALISDEVVRTELFKRFESYMKKIGGSASVDLSNGSSCILGLVPADVSFSDLLDFIRENNIYVQIEFSCGLYNLLVFPKSLR